jgi:putative spermidine/putrescine transport system permease protein
METWLGERSMNPPTKLAAQSSATASQAYRFRGTAERLGLLLPAFALFSVGLIAPFVAMVRGINLRLSDPILPLAVLVRVEMTTLWIAILVALVVTTLATMVVLIMRRVSPGMKKGIMWICLFPLGVNIAFRVFGVQFVLAELGFIFGNLHKVIPALSFSPEQILFTQTATVIGLVHWLFPVAVLVVSSGLGNIRQDLIEAASLLGAPVYVVLCRVVLPALRFQVLLCFVLSFCLAYGSYITPAALGGIGDITVARLIGTLLDEGHSQVAIVPAIVGIVTPLVVAVLVMLAGNALNPTRHAK